MALVCVPLLAVLVMHFGMVVVVVVVLLLLVLLLLCYWR